MNVVFVTTLIGRETFPGARVCGGHAGANVVPFFLSYRGDLQSPSLSTLGTGGPRLAHIVSLALHGGWQWSVSPVDLKRDATLQLVVVER